jgi:PII-like signaling protein
MEFSEKAKLLRIYISNTDKFKHTTLSEVIVYAAKRYGIKGATVLKGITGYGASSKITSIKFWEITEKIPLIIEIVDDAAKIDEFVLLIQPYFEKIKNGCLITVEEVDILLYRKGKSINK